MKLGIIACGAIVNEVTAIARRRGWDFELTAIPAQLHNRPERIPKAVARQLDAWAGRFDRILVGYAACGAGEALDALLARYPHAVRIPGPHCYEFYGGPVFHAQHEAEPGTFYLTDFLARHFDGLVVKELGLDRFPELRDAYFGNYSDLLYLQQMDEGGELERAKAAAQRLGLTFRHVHSGLEELEERLVRLVEGNKSDDCCWSGFTAKRANSPRSSGRRGEGQEKKPVESKESAMLKDQELTDISVAFPLPRLRVLPQTLPVEGAVRLELEEGVPVFRVTESVQDRIEDLLSAQEERSLSTDEDAELDRYEEIDDFLSFVNRLTRNAISLHADEIG